MRSRFQFSHLNQSCDRADNSTTKNMRSRFQFSHLSQSCDRSLCPEGDRFCFVYVA
ncbi:hypothetical protein [Brunnivagina elsteri]|uniref:hypothetical protein n=1 Tax=Brunnivagina elsteri TaxID=1247191 RepID=UPI00130425B7|nr:hypothetical protein [Calothrix elsteri]